MHRSGTSGQAFPLSAGNNNNPPLNPGDDVTFLCNTLPDRAPGGLAYYMTGIILTIKATLTQPETGGSAIPWDRLVEIFIDNINWFNAWHGTVVSPNFVKGKHYSVIEYIKGGFRYANRKRKAIAANAGSSTINLSLMIYPSVCRIGTLLHDTSQLALLFKDSSLQIQAANASVLDQISTGATLSDVTCKATALMTPRAELVLGTPVETVLHQIASGGPSGSQVNITGFGRNSQLQGVQAKGGVLSLLELTTHNGQSGVLTDPADVTNFSFPWRNQRQINDIDGYFWDQFQAQQPAVRVAVDPGTTTADSEGIGFPYTAVHVDTADTAVLHDCYAFPLGVFPGEDCRLTDLQTADSDQEYNLTTNYISPGNHQILAEYAKSWTPQATLDWVALITGGTNPLAAHVLGADGMAKAKLQQRFPLDKHITRLDQQAFLPFQFE